MTTLLAALDPTRSPGELALSLGMSATVLVAAGYMVYLVRGRRRGA